MSRGEDWQGAGLVKAPPARPGPQTMPPGSQAALWLVWTRVGESDLCLEEDAQRS